jgi:hypothetical protein
MSQPNQPDPTKQTGDNNQPDDQQNDQQLNNDDQPDDNQNQQPPAGSRDSGRTPQADENSLSSNTNQQR